MDTHSKKYRAGYQNRPDAMRDRADELMGRGGKGESLQKIANNAYRQKRKDAEKYQEAEHHEYEKMRRMQQAEYERRKKYEEKKDHRDHEMYEEHKRNDPKFKHEMDEDNFKKGGCVKKSAMKIQKFAAGGAAKVRLGEATAAGKPKAPKKTLSKAMYF
jgi:hypothetical protein